VVEYIQNFFHTNANQIAFSTTGYPSDLVLLELKELLSMEPTGFCLRTDLPSLLWCR
tara:strand:- start:723 stop:893 length:171 start_codon:yes stop_codon:yes gene_type:complete